LIFAESQHSEQPSDTNTLQDFENRYSNFNPAQLQLLFRAALMKPMQQESAVRLHASTDTQAELIPSITAQPLDRSRVRLLMKEQPNLRALPPWAKSEEARNSTQKSQSRTNNLMTEPETRAA